MISERPLTLSAGEGEAVSLEARLGMPANAAAGIAICHPHPLYGGDMDNPVVVRIAEVAADAGCATLRFNFRGVGRSTGAYGGGTGEQADLAAVVAHLRSLLSPDAPVIAAGYSFGSLVAAHVAAGGGVDAVALVAPPLGLGDTRPLPELPTPMPVLIVVGENDEYCPAEVVERLRAERPTATLNVIDGANHFFFGKLYPLGEAFTAWLAPTLARLRAGQARRSGGAG
jgi:alpha/beta superfamily hydrolase